MLLQLGIFLGDTMDSWDLKKLEEVIKVKHGSSQTTKPTDIVCKYFLDALEKKVIYN
jgi:hypothetical protein